MKNAAASDQGGLKQTQRRFVKKDKRSIIDVWSHARRQKQELKELNKKQRKGKRERNWKGTKTTKDQKEQVRAVAVIFMCVVFG